MNSPFLSGRLVRGSTYTAEVQLPHLSRWVQRFVVAEDSMRPTLEPGDGVLGVATSRISRGQLRVVEHPHRAGFWLVKRVGDITGRGSNARFEALSDNPDAIGAVDSQRLGLLPVAGSYRVIWVRRAVGPVTR